VIAQNENLMTRPRLLNADSFGKGWMLIVRPNDPEWRSGLVSGSVIGPTMEKWIAGGSYKDRTG
jgi:glycine cleavage system H lipoate-binding protein